MFYFYKSFWSVLQSQALETPQLGFRELKRPQILLNLTCLCNKASQTFSGTFSGTLLNLTWLCTKASRNLLRNPVEPDLALHQGPSPEPSPEAFWTWPVSAPKPPRPSHLVEPDPTPAPVHTGAILGTQVFRHLIPSFNPFHPFTPQKGSGGLKGLKGLSHLILFILLILWNLLILLILKKALED